MRLISCYRSASAVAGGGTINGGEPTGSISAMVFPLRNPPVPLDPDADHLRPFLAAKRKQATAEHGLAEPTGEGDLQRLEASVAWLRREALIVRPDGGLCDRKQKVVALPRAAQLAPVSGIPLVSAESSFHKRETATFQVAPPLPFERLQPALPRRRHRRNLRGALFILIASTIVGSITYRVSVGGMFPASVPAQAALLHPQ